MSGSRPGSLCGDSSYSSSKVIAEAVDQNEGKTFGVLLNHNYSRHAVEHRVKFGPDLSAFALF